jgi:hypothetical protein
MDNMNPIDKALGLRPLEAALEDAETTVEQVPVVVADVHTEITKNSSSDDETLLDIEKARVNIQDIIEKGGDSLKEMIDLAKQSESPRAFEVAANLMKTLLDANKDFVDMSMKKKYQKEEIDGPKEAAQTNVTNNNLILSTKDLLDLIKNGDANDQ